jgi:CubicO group peptidase (beta-lactamase class C family)
MPTKTFQVTSTPRPEPTLLVTRTAAQSATNIQAATSTVVPTQTATLPVREPSLSVDQDPQIDNVLIELTQRKEFSGSVLVARGTNVLFRQGYGYSDRSQEIPNTPQTRFRIGSLTKSFTAAAVLQLQTQGKLNLQDPICVYLLPCPAAWQTITIHELLTHTSGIPDYANSGSFAQIQDQACTPTQITALFQGLPLLFSPGSQWSYSNSGYVLLGMIIEKVSGEGYEEYVEQHLLQPLDLENTGLDPAAGPLAVGYEDSETKAFPMDMSSLFSAGGFYSTITDLFRWYQALTSGEILPKSLSDLMVTPFVTTQDGTGRSYGYAWFLGGGTDHPWASHGGRVAGFSATVIHYRSDDLFVLVLSNQANVNADGIGLRIGKILLENKHP